MMNLRSTLLFLLCTCIGTSLAHAETGAHFTIIAPYGGGDLTDSGFLDKKGNFQKVKWPRQRRSPEYAVPDTRNLTLVKPHVSEEDGKTIYLPVLELDWPADTEEALFVIIAPDNGQPRAIGLDDHVDSFPYNTMKVLNGIDRPVYALAGESKFRLEPGNLSREFPVEDYFQIDEDSPNPGMPVAIGVDSNGEYDLLYASSVSVFPQTRALCIILPPKKEGSDRYQTRLVLY